MKEDNQVPSKAVSLSLSLSLRQTIVDFCDGKAFLPRRSHSHRAEQKRGGGVPLDCSGSVALFAESPRAHTHTRARVTRLSVSFGSEGRGEGDCFPLYQYNQRRSSEWHGTLFIVLRKARETESADDDSAAPSFDALRHLRLIGSFLRRRENWPKSLLHLPLIRSFVRSGNLGICPIFLESLVVFVVLSSSSSSSSHITLHWRTNGNSQLPRSLHHGQTRCGAHTARSLSPSPPPRPRPRPRAPCALLARPPSGPPSAPLRSCGIDVKFPLLFPPSSPFSAAIIHHRTKKEKERKKTEEKVVSFVKLLSRR